MSYTFETIDSYIQSTINPEINDLKKFTYLENKKHISFVKSELEVSRLKMQNDYFDPAKQQSLSHYIHAHQERIIYLANELLRYSTSHKGKSNKKLYEDLLLILEDFLSYMETFFVKHFNLFAAIPPMYRSIVEQELNLKIADLKNKGDLFSIDPELLNAIAEPIEIYLEDPYSKKLTYGLVILFKEVLHDCLEVFQKPVRVSNRALIQVLHNVNFNHSLFISYLTSTIAKETNNLVSKEEKLEKLDFHIFETENIFIGKPEFTFFSKVPTTQELLLLWLKGQRILQERSKINQFIAPEKEIRKPAPFMIMFNVTQISFIIKLMSECKMSGDVNDKKLAEIFSLIFCTPNTEIISAESLRTKYSSINLKEMKEVKDELIKLLTQINTHINRASKK